MDHQTLNKMCQLDVDPATLPTLRGPPHHPDPKLLADVILGKITRYPYLSNQTTTDLEASTAATRGFR